MTAVSCCEICGRPLRFGMMSIQKFLNAMHDKIHYLQSQSQTIEKMHKRLENCQPENKQKIEQQYAEILSEYKDKYASFSDDFNNPYFAKVIVHYPELESVFKQYKSKLEHSKVSQYLQV